MADPSSHSVLPRRKKVLIVGAGRRGQNSLLPSFRSLPDHFEICGLHSRTAEKFVPIARKWEVPAVTHLSNFDLSEIDLVAISVPTKQNAPVLEALLPYAKRLRILIDTPIAWNVEEAARTRPLLEQFAGVTVAEDHMNFPFHSLVREAAVSGIIGRPRSVSLFNIGYLYHGLAIIRSFASFAPVKSAWRKLLGSHAKIVGYEFADGFTGTLIGPYRRQEKVGGILLEGSEGIISEAPMDANYIGHKRKMYVLQPTRSDGLLTGYRISGPGYDVSADLAQLRTMRALDFKDKSEINLIQNCALMDVILSIFHDHNMNRNYSYTQAVYDSLVSQRADSGEKRLDPLELLPAAA